MIDTKNLLSKINEDLKILISKIFNIDEDIKSTTRLTNGGISLNSIQVILLISKIEEHFNIVMNTNILLGNNFKDINTLSRVLIQNHRNELIKNMKLDNL